MKTEFKPGDKVIVTSWYFGEIELPQEAEVIIVPSDDQETYVLRLSKVSNWMDCISDWYFQEGEFHLAEPKEDVNKELLQGLILKLESYRSDVVGIPNDYTMGREFALKTAIFLIQTEIDKLK